MHLWRLWIALSLFAAFAAAAAVVYKWTDAGGVVHYSDHAVPGADRIVTSSSSANGIGGPAPPVPQPPAPKRPASGLDYSVFKLESPANEQVFFGDDIVPIRLHLEPGLNPNHSVAWLLNGKHLDGQPPDVLSTSLQGLPRGTYTIAATVTDSVTDQSKTTDSVTFYVRQPSELSPQHKIP